MDWGHCLLFCTQNKLVVTAWSPNVKGQFRCSSQCTRLLPHWSNNPRTCPYWSASYPGCGITTANLFLSRAAFCTCSGVKEQTKLSHLPEDVGVLPVTGPNSNAGAAPHRNSCFQVRFKLHIFHQGVTSLLFPVHFSIQLKCSGHSQVFQRCHLLTRCFIS